MTRWVPNRDTWKDQDAYIIGGGDSLRTFDWELIRGKPTIGCNSNCILGAEIVKFVIFADWKWWDKIGREKLPKYGGSVVSACPRLNERKDCPSWLLRMDRHTKPGLGKTNLGFNGNTGSLAVNLALILGAKRVFLLGFDMMLGNTGKANWHDVRHSVGMPGVYPRFLAGFNQVAKTLPLVFPEREIINVTNDSRLEAFPKQTIEDHFGKKKGDHNASMAS